jgi:hypothetical protein
MTKIKARDLLAYDRQQIQTTLPDNLIVIFDDGVEVESTIRKLIYSDFFWDIHRLYPNTPLLFRHHVDSVLKGKPLTSKTHVKLLGVINNDVCDTYQLNTAFEREPLLKLIYQVTNNIHNDVSKLSESHVASIDILDFIEVVDHPGVKEAVDAVTNDDRSIMLCYETVTDILNNDPKLLKNALTVAVRSEMVNINQVLQCVTVRGKVTEVDGSILPTAILSSYTRGLNSLYDVIAESRSAAKSLYFSDSKLKDAEYFARRIQLLSMVVEKIDYVDCGSTHYIDWRITPPEKDDQGNTIYPGDQVFMLGKYYLADDGVTLKTIDFDDPALYNKVIKIRSVLFCKHPDPHKVCEVCFGKLAKNVSRFANLGHLCAATMTQQTTQSVLSIKHLDYSSSGADVILSEIAKRFFTTNKVKNSYILKKEFKKSNLRIVINREEAVGLVDILNIDIIANISPIRVSSVSGFDILYTEKDVDMVVPIDVVQGNRRVIITKELLQYLKDNRWETDGKNNFVFDMSNWDYSLPVFLLPEVEYSFSDHSTLIAKVIESSMKDMTERAKPDSPIATLQELFSLVNTKINVNISALEVIVYATMIKGENDYGMGRNAEQPMLGVAELVIKNRSLGAAYTYEDIFKTLTSPRSFFKEGRCDSVFDAFLCGQEYLAARK